jgi:hypothetical protein
MRTGLVRVASVLGVMAGLGLGAACNDGTTRSINAPLPDAPRPSDATTADGENCFDGIDNNGNGLIDCADPSCAGIAMCAAAVPAGWMGHAALYDGATMPTFGCAAPYSERHVFFAGVADTRNCSACDCGPPSGGMCAPSGGASIGAVVGVAATTFCCMANSAR